MFLFCERRYCYRAVKISFFYIFFCSEVFKALNKTRGLYLRWTELQDESVCMTKDEVEWTNTELKNSLRSIEWDLEDLEDTIDILFVLFVFYI